MKSHLLYTSNYIIENQNHFIDQCNYFKENFPESDTTWTYNKYNIFSLTSGSIFFFNLFREFRTFIKKNISNEHIWFQSWLNFHKESEVLDWHNHYWDYHGYISIDPKDTNTEFEDYSIYNKVGQIYLGPGNKKHRVIVNSPYDGNRITIGYDIMIDPFPDHNCLGMFPLL
jgi:hypothetical protein